MVEHDGAGVLLRSGEHFTMVHGPSLVGVAEPLAERRDAEQRRRCRRRTVRVTTLRRRRVGDGGGVAEVKVYTVWVRDPWTGTDMEFVVATTTRAELHAVLVRCDLRRREAEIFRRKADDDGSARALAEVGTLLWRDPEISSAWRDEQALADHRKTYAEARPQGWRGGRRP